MNGFRAKYDPHGNIICEDFDECSSECTNECDRDFAYCVNLPGSYQCRCKSGFSGSGKIGECLDVDECNNNAMGTF